MHIVCILYAIYPPEQMALPKCGEFFHIYPASCQALNALAAHYSAGQVLLSALLASGLLLPFLLNAPPVPGAPGSTARFGKLSGEDGRPRLHRPGGLRVGARPLAGKQCTGSPEILPQSAED